MEESGHDFSATLNVQTSPIDEDSFHLLWFPILSAFLRVILDSQSDNVKMLAMDSLFGVLDKHGHLFEPRYWVKISRFIVLPIFQEIGERADIAAHKGKGSAAYSKYQTGSEAHAVSLANSSMLIHCIRLFVNVVSNNLHKLISTDGEDSIRTLLNLMVEMLQVKDEKLATTGGICINQFLTDNIEVISRYNGWHVVTESLTRAFILTSPAKLLLCEYPAPAQSRKKRRPKRNLNVLSSDTLLFNPPYQSTQENTKGVPQSPNEGANNGDDFHAQHAARIAYNLSRAMGERVTLETLDFDHTLVKCVTHLDLVQSLQQLALTTVEVDEKLLEENCMYNYRISGPQGGKNSYYAPSNRDSAKRNFHHHIAKRDAVDSTTNVHKTFKYHENSGVNLDSSAGLDHFDNKSGAASDPEYDSSLNDGIDFHASPKRKGYNNGIILSVVGKDKNAESKSNKVSHVMPTDSLDTDAAEEHHFSKDTVDKNTDRHLGKSRNGRMHVTQLINVLPEECRSHWLAAIYSAYAVARAFNEDYDLRYAIYKKGLVPQLPHLVKQETVSLNAYLEILLVVLADKYGRSFTMFIFGIGSGVLSFPEGCVVTGNPVISSQSGVDLTQMFVNMQAVTAVDSVVTEVISLMERFLDYSQEPSKFQLHLGLWAPVLNMALQKLTQPEFGWIWPRSSERMLRSMNSSTTVPANLRTNPLNISSLTSVNDELVNDSDDCDEGGDYSEGENGVVTNDRIVSQHSSSTKPVAEDDSPYFSTRTQLEKPEAALQPQPECSDQRMSLSKQRQLRRIADLNYIFPNGSRCRRNSVIPHHIYNLILSKYESEAAIVRRAIPRLYELCIHMLSVDVYDLRKYISTFLFKVGLEYVV